MFESIESTRLSEALSGIRPPLPVISPFVPLRTRRYLVEHPIAFCAEEVHVGDQDVALWCCQTVNVDRRLLDYPGRLGFLSESELEGCRRFMFAHDRDMYVVARILVRTVLSLFESIEPSAWRFVTNAYGRPEIAPGLGVMGLRFNVAHSGGLVICAVTRRRDIGVDIERVDRRASVAELARHTCSEYELSVMERLPEAHHPLAFFQFWTLKEAYVKARGLGLSLPLEQISFDIRSDRDISVTLSEAVGDDEPSRWRFLQFSLFGSYVGALALPR